MAGAARREPATTSDSYARQIADAEHWDLRNVIAVVEIGPKTVSSLEGHRRATTSPYYAKRLELLPDRLDKVRRAIRERDLDALGPVLEEEAIDLHLITMSSHPPIFYWSPGTLAVLRAVRELRQEGLAAWATMDAGANVHVICDADSEDDVAERLENLPGRRLRDPRRHRPRPGPGGGASVLGGTQGTSGTPGAAGRRFLLFLPSLGSLMSLVSPFSHARPPPPQARRQPDHRQGAAGDAAPRGDRPPGRRRSPAPRGAPRSA